MESIQRLFVYNPDTTSNVKHKHVGLICYKAKTLATSEKSTKNLNIFGLDEVETQLLIIKFL